MTPLLEFGPSSTTAGRLALGLGVVLLVLALVRRAPWGKPAPNGTLVVRYGLLAALLSWGYVVAFLHGGPRIVDATSYFLEARALAEKLLAFPVPEPTAAFRGRFTVFGPHGLSVIFPPGYPFLLALGFRVGAPMLVGPLIAGLLVAATYFATRELLGRNDAARLAALISALCAALRYHTADTMSHGLSALLLAASVGAAARPTLVRAALAGVLAGWLLATRPVTGAVGTTLVLALVTLRSAKRERFLYVLATVVWLTPGVGLLALHQRAATGSFLGSTQLAYYSLADGPPGCFRWGFGSNVGCRFEHGDFVKRHLQGGFGFLAAARTTLERLAWHLFDVANLAPAAFLIPWVAWRERHDRGVRWAVGGVLGVFLAYVPFYYPGNYPGGGARFYADVLPLEHGLIALALVQLGLERFAPAGLLLGFALSTVHAHSALADREGGRPMFQPRELASIRKGLVFVKTDHGFALGHDPKQHDPQRGLVVARGFGDAHDRLLWERLGRPPSFLYDYSVETGRTRVTAYSPRAATFRWEAEAEWPPLAVTAGWAHPDFRPCLSEGRGLHLRPTPVVAVDLELGAPKTDDYGVTLGWLADPGSALVVTLAGRSVRVVHGPAGCERTALGSFRLGPTNRIGVRTETDTHLDYLELGATNSKYR